MVLARYNTIEQGRVKCHSALVDLHIVHYYFYKELFSYCDNVKKIHELRYLTTFHFDCSNIKQCTMILVFIAVRK